MQISLTYSEENDTQTLGLIPGRVQRFRMNDVRLKVPHMGWNEVTVQQAHPLLAGVVPGDEFYFVHAYYPEPDDPAVIFATANYERNFACALGRGNYFGTQFHPEKSGRVGLDLLARFARWDGRAGALAA